MAGNGTVKRRHLIIGSGPAALAALEKTRSITSEDEITLVTKEDVYPYSPMVLPYLLSGKIKETDSALRGKSYFENLKSSLVKGREAIAVDPDRKEVVYSAGHVDTYDTLLIASGSEPVKPVVTSMDTRGQARGTLRFGLLEKVCFLGLHMMGDHRIWGYAVQERCAQTPFQEVFYEKNCR